MFTPVSVTECFARQALFARRPISLAPAPRRDAEPAENDVPEDARIERVAAAVRG